MGHQHSNNHSHSHNDLKGRNLFISILLNILITVAQVIGGIFSGSLALLSDALHNFSDVISLVVSFIANKLAILLIIEAVKRFQNPEEIESNLVIWLSLLGIIANGLSVLLLKKDSEANMNMKSAYLHLLTDMMASVAVLIGGLLMKYYQVYWVDSVLTFIIGLYLIWMGFDLLKNSTKLLMLFTPDTIPIKKIVEEINGFETIKNVHHVHVWQLNEAEIHLEAHIDFNKNITLSEFDIILHEIEHLVFHKYDINHVNIQPEFGKDDAKDVIVQD